MEDKTLGSQNISRIELPTPFPVGPVNVYVIEDKEERVLVDCGPKTKEARDALLAGLTSLNLAPDDLTAVVLTHGHVDHVGLCSFFQSRGIPVFSHPEVQSWLNPGGPWDEYRKEFYLRYYAEMGMPESDIQRALHEFSLFVRWNDRSVVDFELRDGDVFPPLPNFKIVEVPGHAKAAIALYDEQSGKLIVGDQLLPHISSNAFIEPTLTAARGREADYTHSLLDYRRNLKYLQSLPIRRVYPGHGTPFEDVQALFVRRFAEQEKRRRQMLELLSTRQPASAYDIASQYFSHRRDQPSLILSETLGYLDWLHHDGVVQQHQTMAGVLHWSIV